MPEQIDRAISFRSQLSGELSDFLRDESFTCTATNEAVVALVDALSNYKEEGVTLSPEIYICNDIKKIASFLQGAEFIKIGHGERNAETSTKILKECAPLAQEGWSIYIERNTNEFSYGIFTDSKLPFAMTPDEVLIDEDNSGIPAIIISKLANSCVEIRGANGNRRCVHFSAVRENSPTPKMAIEKLSSAITLHVKEKDRVDTYRFTYKMLTNIIQESHGVLAIVLRPRCKKLPKAIADAIQLDEPIVFSKRISEFRVHNDTEAMIRLQAIKPILAGMINSDGIVVFRSDGTVLGYRAFMNQQSKVSLQGQVSGGARKRTFKSLNKLVDKKLITGAFFCSQDGYTEYYGESENE